MARISDSSKLSAAASAHGGSGQPQSSAQPINYNSTANQHGLIPSSREWPPQAPASTTPNGRSIPSAKSRCYLCEIPKYEYSLVRSFSEIICRGCLNYEGHERVEQLILDARRDKGSREATVVDLTTNSPSGANTGGPTPQQVASESSSNNDSTINPSTCSTQRQSSARSKASSRRQINQAQASSASGCLAPATCNLQQAAPASGQWGGQPTAQLVRAPNGLPVPPEADFGESIKRSMSQQQLPVCLNPKRNSPCQQLIWKGNEPTSGGGTKSQAPTHLERLRTIDGMAQSTNISQHPYRSSSGQNQAYTSSAQYQTVGSPVLAVASAGQNVCGSERPSPTLSNSPGALIRRPLATASHPQPLPVPYAIPPALALPYNHMVRDMGTCDSIIREYAHDLIFINHQQRSQLAAHAAAAAAAAAANQQHFTSHHHQPQINPRHPSQQQQQLEGTSSAPVDMFSAPGRQVVGQGAGSRSQPNVLGAGTLKQPPPSLNPALFPPTNGATYPFMHHSFMPHLGHSPLTGNYHPGYCLPGQTYPFQSHHLHNPPSSMLTGNGAAPNYASLLITTTPANSSANLLKSSTAPSSTAAAADADAEAIAAHDSPYMQLERRAPISGSDTEMQVASRKQLSLRNQADLGANNQQQLLDRCDSISPPPQPIPSKRTNIAPDQQLPPTDVTLRILLNSDQTTNNCTPTSKARPPGANGINRRSSSVNAGTGDNKEPEAMMGGGVGSSRKSSSSLDAAAAGDLGNPLAKYHNGGSILTHNHSPNKPFRLGPAPVKRPYNLEEISPSHKPAYKPSSTQLQSGLKDSSGKRNQAHSMQQPILMHEDEFESKDASLGSSRQPDSSVYQSATGGGTNRQVPKSGDKDSLSNTLSPPPPSANLHHHSQHHQANCNYSLRSQSSSGGGSHQPPLVGLHSAGQSPALNCSTNSSTSTVSATSAAGAGFCDRNLEKNGGSNSAPTARAAPRQQQGSNQPSTAPAAMGNSPASGFDQLKCLLCDEPLEDRHFVQCPTVQLHKFCFACSKVSIQKQRNENKDSKSNEDKIFCPSGKKCLLASERSPWTFMNNEIETIFRESSRASGDISKLNHQDNNKHAKDYYDINLKSLASAGGPANPSSIDANGNEFNHEKSNNDNGLAKQQSANGGAPTLNGNSNSSAPIGGNTTNK